MTSPAAPKKKLAVLACMDARLDPAPLLGFERGDAHVIRNAGGVASDDAVRSLAISQHMLGTEEIAVIQHTKCGMTSITDDEFAGRMEQHAGERPPWPVHSFADLEESVRETVEALRASPFLARTDAIRGYVYDVDTGELRELV